MRRRKSLGFRWFCGTCVVGADDILRENRVASLLEEKMASSLSTALKGLEVRLERMETSLGSVGSSTSAAGLERESFADILKHKVGEPGNKRASKIVSVKDHGKTRQVLK